MNLDNWKLVWIQTLTGGEEVLESGLTRAQAVAKKLDMEKPENRWMIGPGGVLIVREGKST